MLKLNPLPPTTGTQFGTLILIWFAPLIKKFNASIQRLIYPLMPSQTSLTVSPIPFQILSHLSFRLSNAPVRKSLTVSNTGLIASIPFLNTSTILSQFFQINIPATIAAVIPIIISPIGPIAKFNAAIAVDCAQVAAVAIA